jgi:hypothetical protein
VDLVVKVYYSQVAEDLDLERRANEDSVDIRQVSRS